MAGHEIEKGEVGPINDKPRNTTTTQSQEDCTDQYFECVSECDINDTECETVCVEDLKECDLPWEEDEMTVEEDKFMEMNEGELVSELLQIAALLNGTCERSESLNSTGRSSKRITIEYDIQQRDQGSSQEA